MFKLPVVVVNEQADAHFMPVFIFTER